MFLPFLVIVFHIQRVVGDKTFNQLEKIINPKLEATVTKQIQLQFQTSGRQALQVCILILSCYWVSDDINTFHLPENLYGFYIFTI